MQKDEFQKQIRSNLNVVFGLFLLSGLEGMDWKEN